MGGVPALDEFIATAAYEAARPRPRALPWPIWIWRMAQYAPDAAGADPGRRADDDYGSDGVAVFGMSDGVFPPASEQDGGRGG